MVSSHSLKVVSEMKLTICVLPFLTVIITNKVRCDADERPTLLTGASSAFVYVRFGAVMRTHENSFLMRVPARMRALKLDTFLSQWLFNPKGSLSAPIGQ